MKQVDIEIAIKKRYPESIALIVCKDKDDKVDVTPISWFMICNDKPAYWAISLYNKHFSHHVISETNEFVLCLPSYSQKRDILYCGNVHGWNSNKLEKCKFQTIKAKKVRPPILKDTIACFECTVVQKIKISDHTVFIGKILVSYTSRKKDKVYNYADKIDLKSSCL
jgi:flavin reductase (DIM6/NTAB) family NADH-FMN oxidoreductase RutF